MPARFFLSTVRGVLAVLALGGATAAGAEPVSLSVTSFAISLGNGYGTDTSEPGGTKLDAAFSTAAFAIQNFEMTNVNDSFTLNVGTVSFNESSIGGQETDDLNLSAFFTFANFGGGVQTIAGTGAAQPGTATTIEGRTSRFPGRHLRSLLAMGCAFASTTPMTGAPRASTDVLGVCMAPRREPPSASS